MKAFNESLSIEQVEVFLGAYKAHIVYLKKNIYEILWKPYANTPKSELFFLLFVFVGMYKCINKLQLPVYVFDRCFVTI